MNDQIQDDVLLDVQDLTVRFNVGGGGLFGESRYLYAVDNISFQIKRGETLAIVGESGSGKTTAALAVARLVEAYKGRVDLAGTDFLTLEDEDLRQARAKMQFIFQDPYSSLNPRLRASAVVREPLDSLTTLSEGEKQAAVDRLFTEVGLRKEQQSLFPHQFSGGQRQRIGIARALATPPAVPLSNPEMSN